MDGAAMPPLALELRAEIADLYAAYGDVLDAGEYEQWAALFTARCLYLVIPRENHERGLPLATLRAESRAMLEDRVHAIRQTQLFVPRWIRHVIGAPRVLGMADGTIAARASYAVFETQPDQLTRVLNVGRYEDEIVRDEGRLRFRRKLCVFDSILVPTSLVLPV
jgi:salicylate 5-hydroxylase small subunit